MTTIKGIGPQTQQERPQSSLSTQTESVKTSSADAPPVVISTPARRSYNPEEIDPSSTVQSVVDAMKEAGDITRVHSSLDTSRVLDLLRDDSE